MPEVKQNSKNVDQQQGKIEKRAEKLPTKVQRLVNITEKKGESIGYLKAQLKDSLKKEQWVLKSILDKIPVAKVEISDKLAWILSYLQEYKWDDFTAEVQKAGRSMYIHQYTLKVWGELLTIEDIILNISYSKKWFFLKTPEQKVLLPNWSDIIKLVQIFLEWANFSVLDGNKKNLQESIDWYVGNDTRNALLNFKSALVLYGWIREVFAMVKKLKYDNTSVITKWTENRVQEKVFTWKEEYKERKLEPVSENIGSIKRYIIERVQEVRYDLPKKAEININMSRYPIIELNSYSKTACFDFDKWLVFIETSGGKKVEMPKDFILNIHANWELLNTEKDKENFRNVLKTLNVINLFRKNFSKIKRDREEPAHIEYDMTRSSLLKIIEMNTEDFLDDKNLITVDTMQDYLVPFTMTVEEFVRFLNIIYDNDNVPNSKLKDNRTHNYIVE